jgi:hypothetical protein
MADPVTTKDNREKLTEAAESLVAALAGAIKERQRASGENEVTLKEGWSFRDRNSAKASEIIRQMALAGVAVVWIFRSAQQGPNQVPPGELVPPIFLFLMCLGADLLQYLVATVLWQYHTKQAQKGGKKEFTAPDWINQPAWWLFGIKSVLAAVAYLYLILYFAGR